MGDPAKGHSAYANFSPAIPDVDKNKSTRMKHFLNKKGISVIDNKAERFNDLLDAPEKKNEVEMPYMVNEYFNDVNGFSFYMQLRKDQKDNEDLKRIKNRSGGSRLRSSIPIKKRQELHPITSMSHHYKVMKNLRDKGQLDHQWVR